MDSEIEGLKSAEEDVKISLARFIRARFFWMRSEEEVQVRTSFARALIFLVWSA